VADAFNSLSQHKQQKCISRLLGSFAVASKEFDCSVVFMGLPFSKQMAAAWVGLLVWCANIRQLHGFVFEKKNVFFASIITCIIFCQPVEFTVS
jgi:hypothetical protein